MLPTVEESRGYDFEDPENVEKWRGLFVGSLRTVLEHVHPSLKAEESALQYVESLCLRLLGMLCAVPVPLTQQDVEERVARLFPKPLDKWALTDARESIGSKRRKPMLPADKLHALLHKEVLLYKVDGSVTTFMTAILEYISADILKLAGNFIKKIAHKVGDSITCRDIKTAMCADKVLMDMFYQDSELAAVDSTNNTNRPLGRRGSLTYSELVRDLLADEKHFLRDLNLIIRVFKDELEKILDNDSERISLIFGNIEDIYELTLTLVGNLEDAMEMLQDTPTPYVGLIFAELAEVEEFRAYVRYANNVTKKASRDALQQIVDDPVLSERIDTAGHGFRLCVKYYLPRLLLAPVAHVALYHSYVLALLQLADATEDAESFKQVECNLLPIKKTLMENMKSMGNGPKIDTTLRMASRARRQLAIEKCHELSKLVDNWDKKDFGQCCNEFIREDTLFKIGKRQTERRAYLFDGLLLLCKPITSLTTTSSAPAGGGAQLKLKERLYIRKCDIVDKPDTEEYRHVVEVVPREGATVLLACSSALDKRSWMCDLLIANTKPMLDRSLDSILLDLEKRHPLKLPPPSLYRFAEEDSPDNLVLEPRRPGNSVPLIKGATLVKLVERVTYHHYADLHLVRTFLTTYRSFCSPAELLALLVERFNIPPVSAVCEHVEDDVPAPEPEKMTNKTTREDWKRYRKEFEQPVKFRVINVIRHWVDQHFYDFERDEALLEQLVTFLESVDGKPMKKWVQSVLKIVQRKRMGNEPEWPSIAPVFDKQPPPPQRHHHPAQHAWHPLSLHPLELARQATLLHFTMYKQVKPSELVGAVWTKKDKEKTSPNLLRIIKHTTNFTRWMEKWIVESENLEERVGVVSRLLEMAICLHELNNFNGVLAVVAAMGSASVHRLKTTFQLVSFRLTRALEEYRLLNSDHFRRYQERLRSINPPCVPFCGMYLTNLLHIEEGNQDFLKDSDNKLINFSKRRKVAEITGEIQQYQNQPYCITLEPETRAFLENLDPFPGMDDKEITDYLYEKSLEIEPRPPVKQMPKFARRYPELSLKPMKISRRAHDQPTANNNNNSDDNISVSQLSPTSLMTWDGGSVSSLPIDSSKLEEKCLISPRVERSGSNSFSQFSLFDKGLALFDKKGSHTLNTRSWTREEPPSPRDRTSPRHDRTPTSADRKPALSPRGAIVDAELFYSRSTAPKPSDSSPAGAVVPPLLPRGSLPAPPLPRRHASPPPPPITPQHTLSRSLISWSPPPEPPDRPSHSPKLYDASSTSLSRMPLISPKRSPHSPLDRSAFRFPSPPPPAPHPSSITACSTPPPLPPRRRRDSALSVTPDTQVPCLETLTPPPLPPRPAPPPPLQRVAHSALLQRRRTALPNTAPKLPPKPRT